MGMSKKLAIDYVIPPPVTQLTSDPVNTVEIPNAPKKRFSLSSNPDEGIDMHC